MNSEKTKQTKILTSQHFDPQGNYAIAYHPDADGFGSLALLRLALPDAHFLLFSIDSPQRDLEEAQMQRLRGALACGHTAIFLDHTPANPAQIQEITQHTTFYIDHHAMPTDFLNFLPQITAHHPQLVDPQNIDAYAAGMQVFQIFQEPKDGLPLVLISLFGDNKTQYWEQQLALKEIPHAEELQQLALQLNIAGLSRPCGGYQPHRTDALFEEAFDRCMRAFQTHHTQGLLQAFSHTQLAARAKQLQQKIEAQKPIVAEHLQQQKRYIPILDEHDILPPILLKWAFQELDFQGPFLLYQVDPITQEVHLAFMQKHSDFHCAQAIQQSPLVRGGGHYNRAGAVGDANQLQEILHSLLPL
ncbi:MAG: hypothetical protein H6727_19610 [Myxococcales bacterium]|nr:hypothetical protein [Myxococcales bacterium]